MKKTVYVFAALLAGVVMVACDKDDNGGGETKLVPVEYSVPATVSLDGINLAYTKANGKVSKILLDDGGDGVEYTITYGTNLCTVNFDNGEAVTAKIQLNADGYAEHATIEYDSDNTVYSEATFTYSADKMLTKVVDGDNMVVFEASYKGQVIKSFKASSLGEDGEIPYTSSKEANTCAIEPLYILTMYGLDAEAHFNAASLAVFCNLLPHPYYLPSSVRVGKDDFKVSCTQNAAGQLTKYDLGGAFVAEFAY